MDEILHQYTAGELLEWLGNSIVDDYIMTVIEEKDGESYPLSVLDTEQIKTDFMREVRRYEIVKRGYTLYLFDNKTCQDLFSWRFDDSNYEEMQNAANVTCDSLNNRTMRFIGKKEKCF